jgi:uncharacterized protein YhjY with autotransporter beta-barrel domain
MRVAVLSLIILLFFFNSNKVYSGTVTMPSTLTTDTTDFVLLSSSGTTPSISGYTGTLLVSAVASDGNIKVTSVTNLMQAAGYCNYPSDNSSVPSQCTGNSLTEIGFRGTQDDINNALATLSFKGDGAAGSPTITVAVTPAGTNYFSGNGHYYELVTGTINWEDAKTAAEASTYLGLTGYLVTITSEAENNFIKNKIGTNTWIGGSDDATHTSNTHPAISLDLGQGTALAGEGTWEWVSGPENGKTFFCQVAIESTTPGVNKADPAHEDCTVASGYSYANWLTDEPNDHPSAEDGDENCAHMYGSPSGRKGKWNDLHCTRDTTGAYVIEYGGTAGESATVSGQTTLTIRSTEVSGFNAFDDKQVSGMANAQTEHAKRFMFNTTNQVMRRMEQFRRVGINKSTRIKDMKLSLSNQNNYKEQIPPELFDYYIDKYKNLSSKNIDDLISELPLTKYLKENYNMTPKDWAFWTAGSINKGRLNLSSGGDLGIINRTESFLLGADVNYNKGSLFGLVFRREDDQSNIGTKDSTGFLARSNNFSLYNTWQGSEKNYIDSFLGFGKTTYATTRITDTSNPSNVVKGKFKANQIFGSVKYNLKNVRKNYKFHNYSKFDLGFVNFDGYSETGSSSSKLKFDKRELETSSISLGSAVEKEIYLTDSLFIPYFKIDFNKDLTDGSDIQANFVGETTKYNTTIEKKYNSMIILETGFDWFLDNGWNIKSVFSRIDKDGVGHENLIELRAVKSRQNLY